MTPEKVVFGFFVLMAATLNLAYVTGEMDVPEHHDPYLLYAAVATNLVATVLRLGERTQVGAVHLATSLVATLQLVVAASVWVWASHVSGGGVTRELMASVVSISAGALLANVVSLTLLILETLRSRHR